MKISFIRHGETKGNRLKKYIGRTDEILCDEGIKTLKKIKYPEADFVVISPMKRCIESAEIIYPEIVPIVRNDLRECDFGDFEGKNYAELNGNDDYQRWIDSGGKMTFPHGENPHDFRKRCCDEFLLTVKEFDENDSVSFVVHGGTIMSVLSEFAIPKKTFYDYSVPNGHGYITEWNGKNLKIISEII